MFTNKCFRIKTSCYGKYLLLNVKKRLFSGNFTHNCYNGIAANIHKCKNRFNYKVLQLSHESLYSGHTYTLHRRCYSNGLLDGDSSSLLKKQEERELKKIAELFPQPRVTLNELNTRTPERAFDIHYKQAVMTPKSKGKKKITQINDWTCVYTFFWPEKIKFESTAKSKRLAAERAATLSLHWLYINKRIDKKGLPFYDKNVLEDIRTTLNEPIHVKISEKSMERIERIWNDYENGIKNIYETTFKEAAQMTTPSAMVMKDSTLDEEDEFPDSEAFADSNIDDISELKVRVHPVYGRIITPPSQSTLDRRDLALKRKFELYNEEITPLPIDQYTEQITSTLDANRVAVIVGAAGCGKSSRAPVALLRHGGARTAAIVAQPRRVAAIGLAERVASELGEQVGESIGYQVRLQARPPRPPCGSILYCTSGVLLRRLQLNPGLEGCTHVIIDEAHERDINTDLTLLLLKRALEVNKDLKIIVMSATLDIDVFTKYFDSCPVIEVPGRTYPVEVLYLDEIQKKFNLQLPSTMKNSLKEDGKPQIYCQEIVELIKMVDKREPEGAILVFLPGWAEIKQAKQLLEQQYGKSPLHMILPVHSRLSTTDQIKMFAKPPAGVRKIVLGTNIAETSITIPDVVYVVDSGAHKENRLREGAGTGSLETVWVSLAGSRQRAGRAGRVTPGHCYRLYTKEKEEEFQEYSTPEILRVPLEQTVLDCKTYAPDDKIEDFLSQLPEPPSLKSIQFAVNDLIDLGALTSGEQLTRLGRLLSTMTLHPRVGRGVLHAAVAGCVTTAANVATYCTHGTEVFVDAADRREETRNIKRNFNEYSDHSALHWIQEEFERSLQEGGNEGAEKWCQQYGLRRDRLRFVKALSSLHLEQLLKSGIVEPSPNIEELNRFSDIDEMTAAILLSGSNSLLKTCRHVRTKGKLKTTMELSTSTGERAHIGTESVNYGITKRNSKTNLLAYFGGHHSSERRALVVYKTSLIPPHTAVLFTMGDVLRDESDVTEETAVLNLRRHRLRVHIPTSQIDHILKAREMLWNTFKYYIERDIMKLDFDENTTVSRFKVRLFKAIAKLLIEADREHVQGKSNVIEPTDDFR